MRVMENVKLLHYLVISLIGSNQFVQHSVAVV